MKDLEKIIRDKRHQMDVDEVPQDTWPGILDQWKKSGKKDYSIYWKVAALLFFLSTISLIVINVQNNKSSSLASLGDISKEYRLLELSYQEQIETIQASIEITDATQKENLEWLFNELEELDRVNEIYRADIGKGVDQERLVSALVDYYEKKIRILRKIELELQRNQNKEDLTLEV